LFKRDWGNRFEAGNVLDKSALRDIERPTAGKSPNVCREVIEAIGLKLS
jgi:hypothetical protein